MHGCPLTLSGETLVARPAGTLWWPARRLLAVADLHLGRSGRLARRGGALLPPYETAETLARLSAEIAATDPARVLALGDSFDDDACLAEALPETRAALDRLSAGRDWVWIAGNHDPLPPDLPGTAAEAVTLGPLTFRHIADPGASGDISGHYHPRARIGAQARPCFLADRTRIILPAFGAYTGGLDCRDPALAALMGPEALAILTGRQALPCPMPRAA